MEQVPVKRRNKKTDKTKLKPNLSIKINQLRGMKSTDLVLTAKKSMPETLKINPLLDCFREHYCIQGKRNLDPFSMISDSNILICTN